MIYRKLSPKKFSRILLAVGSLIIFFAWIAQDVIRNNWQEENSSIKERKANISHNEVNKNIHQATLNLLMNGMEIDTVSPEIFVAELYAYVKYSYLLQYLGINAGQTDSKIQEENRAEYKRSMADIEKWYKQREIMKLYSFAAALSEKEGDDGDTIIAQYEERYRETESKVQFWNLVYIGLNVLGSLFLACGFIVDFRSLE